MIRMVLKGIRQLAVEELSEARATEPQASCVGVDVLACAICRTDAKMWEQGHRDLVFPRVLGHEMVVQNREGQRFIVWPGKSCGHCPYCLAGRENLCDDMKITGFHTDGGFAHRAVLPEQSLIPVPDELDIHAACFAEPVGCVINAFEKLPLHTNHQAQIHQAQDHQAQNHQNQNRQLLIYGGGTMGLITALYARHIGLSPLILEKDAAKIRKISPMLEACGLDCVQETHESRFDLVINVCPDYIALCQAITKVDKGGHISYFSGITKNETVETNLLNLIHYKEASISGGYGMRRVDMERAIPFLISHTRELRMLIEDVVPPESAPELLPKVLKGQALKYILDFTGTEPQAARPETIQERPGADTVEAAGLDPLFTASPFCSDVINGIRPLSRDLEADARAKMDEKTKPLGALGKLEPLAVRLSRILGTLNPRIDHKALFVFAGDHGVTEEGVSAFPSEVTGQMVDNFLNGGAAINVLCHRHGIDLKVVDMGVKREFAPHPLLIRSKVAEGTRNMALEPAMSDAQAIQALEAGMKAFLTARENKRLDIIGLGEMGIGNTTSASAIISAVTGVPPARTTGRGTGVDDQGLSHKTEVIERVLNFHRPAPTNGLEILRTVGGFEIAGIAGAALAAASRGCPVVLDGVISTAAGLIAYLLNPDIADYFIAGHQSVEIAHTAALDHMGLTPVVDLSMRLGEGSGAALAIDLADTACRLMCEMASFEEAKISRLQQTPRTGG